jgi:hypothetical protein
LDIETPSPSTVSRFGVSIKERYEAVPYGIQKEYTPKK